MYEHQGLEDIFYLMLYGGAAMLALTTALYLLLTRNNIVSPFTHPPKELRQWTAAFLFSVALSHIWWVVLGIHWFTDDRLVRNAVAIGLDSITLVPLMMAILLRMLQDRRRPLWPILIAMLPAVGIVVGIGLIMHNPAYEVILSIYLLLSSLAFVVYMVFAVRRYGRWLHDNYANLEHKEVWQSLVLLFTILLMFFAYKTNFGGLLSEYAVQLGTYVLIGFLIWRVESLQQLHASSNDVADNKMTKNPHSIEYSIVIPTNIGSLLEEHCEATQLYLLYDLTLTQLASAIGTNRTYLSAYFAQQGTTYNTYINELRINHFIKLYRESRASGRPFTVLELSQKCGYSSYSTFSTAFKRFTGITPKDWQKQEESEGK